MKKMKKIMKKQKMKIIILGKMMKNQGMKIIKKNKIKKKIEK